MQPIVMSTTYGEREGEMTLANAWEILRAGFRVRDSADMWRIWCRLR